jgi:CDGSH-type Zn-finger protein
VNDPLTIRCRENGPLVLAGVVRIVDHQGNEFPIPPGKELIALCRCGASRNKPFCDGQHKQVGFQGNEVAPAKPEAGI